MLFMKLSPQPAGPLLNPTSPPPAATAISLLISSADFSACGELKQQQGQLTSPGESLRCAAMRSGCSSGCGLVHVVHEVVASTHGAVSAVWPVAGPPVASGSVLLMLHRHAQRLVQEGGHLRDRGAHREGLAADNLLLAQQRGRHVGVLEGDEGEGAEGTRHKDVGDLEKHKGANREILSAPWKR